MTLPMVVSRGPHCAAGACSSYEMENSDCRSTYIVVTSPPDTLRSCLFTSST